MPNGEEFPSEVRMREVRTYLRALGFTRDEAQDIADVFWTTAGQILEAQGIEDDREQAMVAGELVGAFAIGLYRGRDR